jgi:hypothetical protein
MFGRYLHKTNYFRLCGISQVRFKEHEMIQPRRERLPKSTIGREVKHVLRLTGAITAAAGEAEELGLLPSPAEEEDRSR